MNFNARVTENIGFSSNKKTRIPLFLCVLRDGETPGASVLMVVYRLVVGDGFVALLLRVLPPAVCQV